MRGKRQRFVRCKQDDLLLRGAQNGTERRVILINVQGVTGSKVEFLSVPYRAIVRFSVETAGTFDLDAELKIWVSGTPQPIERTLKKGTDVRGIQRALAEGVLR